MMTQYTNKQEATNKIKSSFDKNKESGYSLVELLVVLAIIATLSAAAMLSSMLLFSEGLKTVIINDATAAIPSAVTKCSSINRGVLTSCDKASLMRKASTLQTNTACGDTWAVATSATEVVLTYPLTSCDDKDDIGNDVIELLSKIPRVSTDASKTNYTSPNLKITYLRK